MYHNIELGVKYDLSKALVWMDSRWSKLEVGKGKCPIELAKDEDIIFVQGTE